MKKLLIIAVSSAFIVGLICISEYYNDPLPGGGLEVSPLVLSIYFSLCFLLISGIYFVGKTLASLFQGK